MVSAAIIVCQLPNTILFASFGYNFGQLFILIDHYMGASHGMNYTSKNMSMVYNKSGINGERLHEIDQASYTILSDMDFSIMTSCGLSSWPKSSS